LAIVTITDTAAAAIDVRVDTTFFLWTSNIIYWANKVPIVLMPLTTSSHSINPVQIAVSCKQFPQFHMT
jgi:hypothetical protein